MDFHPLYVARHCLVMCVLTAWLAACGGVAGPDGEYAQGAGELSAKPLAAAKAADSSDDPCIEIANSYIETIESLSSWSFGELDTSHPKYCEIIEKHLDTLMKYIEDGNGLVDVDTEINIKNEAGTHDGLKISALTETSISANGTVSATITYFNPNK